MAKKKRAVKKKSVKRVNRNLKLYKASKSHLIIYGIIAGVIAIAAFVLVVSFMKDAPIPSNNYVNLQP